MNSFPSPNQMQLAEPRRSAKGTKLINSSLTDVYVPTAQEQSILEAITVANGSGSTAAVSVLWTDGTEEYALRRVSLDANTSFDIINVPLPLRFGQSLKVQAATGVDVTVVVKSVPGNLG